MDSRLNSSDLFCPCFCLQFKSRSLGYDEMHETFARPSESKSTDIEMTASSAAVMTVEALEAMEAERLAKIEELEQQAEQMDELDEAPDVPDSDMTD